MWGGGEETGEDVEIIAVRQEEDQNVGQQSAPPPAEEGEIGSEGDKKLAYQQPPAPLTEGDG